MFALLLPDYCSHSTLTLVTHTQLSLLVPNVSENCQLEPGLLTGFQQPWPVVFVKAMLLRTWRYRERPLATYAMCWKRLCKQAQ